LRGLPPAGSPPLQAVGARLADLITPNRAGVPFGGPWPFPIVAGKLQPGADMLLYASRTGTKQNLAAMWAHGIRLLVSCEGAWRDEGFPACWDNGVYSLFQLGLEFNPDKFDRFLDTMKGDPDFIVAPDIIAGGQRSLDLSMRWNNRCRARSNLILIPVQDGMTADDLRPLVSRNTGIFLGGTTDWKLSTMRYWGEFAAAAGCWYHVARVNTLQRFAAAQDAGADSVDGSSGTRFAKNIPKIDAARRRRDLISAKAPWMQDDDGTYQGPTGGPRGSIYYRANRRRSDSL